MARTLYICYFGVREPLVQTQVIPYLREIEKGGTAVLLLTFEPESIGRWPPGEFERIRGELSDIGITWHSLPYHKRPSVPATAYDVLRGTIKIASLLRRDKIDILHGRIHIPMLMAALARRFSRQKPKLLFDIRGFFPEEYTDAGVWPEGGWLYRSAKRVERWLMKESDGFVVLTEKARSILFPESAETGFDRSGRPVEVIPCCIDPGRFGGGEARNAVRDRLGIGERLTLVYVGSFDGWYLSEELLDLFEFVRNHLPDIFVLILTQRDADGVKKRLAARGFRDESMFVGSVGPSEVPEYLAAGDAAVSFIKKCYSKQASSPTKIAEYLAAGLPVISNSGIGDLDELITGDSVGVLIDDFSEIEYKRVVNWLPSAAEMRDRCIKSAHRRFDLGPIGGERYRRVYKRLLESSRPSVGGNESP